MPLAQIVAEGAKTKKYSTASPRFSTGCEDARGQATADEEKLVLTR
jgi:hypothetical protein